MNCHPCPNEMRSHCCWNTTLTLAINHWWSGFGFSPPQAGHWSGTGVKQASNLDLTLLLTLPVQRRSRPATPASGSGSVWFVSGTASCLPTSRKAELVWLITWGHHKVCVFEMHYTKTRWPLVTVCAWSYTDTFIWSDGVQQRRTSFGTTGINSSATHFGHFQLQELTSSRK